MSGPSAGRVVPVDEFIQDLLATTPALRDRARQEVLTQRFLAPALPGLRSLFLALRAEIDPILRRDHPGSPANPFPLGRCLEITHAVQQRLRSLDPASLSGPAAEGCAALRAFTSAGGEVRRAWGDLRREYFQNALIVGTLYVDVSNDTVVATKPPVEILPFAEADFTPIADYDQFARLAAGYWRDRVLPNHLTPRLAPYLPLILISPNGRVRLGEAGNYMLGLTLANGFAPSERALAAPRLPPRLFAGLSSALRGGSTALATSVATSAAEGRAAALACCQIYRAEGRNHCPRSLDRARAAGRAINGQLARLIATPQAA